MVRVRIAPVVILGLFAGALSAGDGGPVVPPIPTADGIGWGPSRTDAPAWAPLAVPPVRQEPAPLPRVPPPQPPAKLPEPRSVRPTEPVLPAIEKKPAEKAPASEPGVVLEPFPNGVTPATYPPVRHGTFGSPNLTLSRDYHFLDLFGAGFIGEESQALLPGEGQPTDNWFVQAEYLLWWVKTGSIPALATTAQGTTFGYLGQPGTEVLLGPGAFGTASRNGFRIRAGGWFDDWWAGCGLDASFFFLGKQSSDLRYDSGQLPTIARPFFAPNLNQEFVELVAFPGLSTGSLLVSTTSRLWGTDVNLRSCICRTCDARTEWFAGYRHLTLDEDLTVTENLVAGENAPDPVGTRIAVNDSFAVRNQFHGAQVGYAAGRRWGAFELDIRASVALGVTHQELEIAGTQTRLRPGQTAPDVFAGGLLAVGPNLGTFTDNKFAVVPEATVTAGYVLMPGVRATIGYNFLFWSNVLRPGGQIDRVVDLSFVPNAPPMARVANRPQPTLQSSDLWVQGLQFGLELRW